MAASRTETLKYLPEIEISGPGAKPSVFSSAFISEMNIGSKNGLHRNFKLREGEYHLVPLVNKSSICVPSGEYNGVSVKMSFLNCRPGPKYINRMEEIPSVKNAESIQNSGSIRNTGSIQKGVKLSVDGIYLNLDVLDHNLNYNSFEPDTDHDINTMNFGSLREEISQSVLKESGQFQREFLTINNGNAESSNPLDGDSDKVDVGCCKICFNVGQELYVYHFEGATEPLDLSCPIDKRLYRGTQPTCHDFRQKTSESDNPLLVVGFSTGQVQLLDPISKATSRLFNEQRRIDQTKVTCIRWVPNSTNQFICCHSGGNLYVYDITIQPSATVPNFLLKKSSQQFSVYVSQPFSNPLYNWKIEGWPCINQMEFSPCGSFFALACGDGYLRVFDYCKMELVSKFKSYFGGLLCLGWSPDGSLIVTGGEDDLVSVWSITENKVIFRGQGHTSWVSSVSFDPYLSIFQVEKNTKYENERTINLQSQEKQTLSKNLKAEHNYQNHIKGPIISKFTYRFGSVGQDGRICLWEMNEEDLNLVKSHHKHGGGVTSRSGSVNVKAEREKTRISNKQENLERGITEKKEGLKNVKIENAVYDAMDLVKANNSATVKMMMDSIAIVDRPSTETRVTPAESVKTMSKNTTDTIQDKAVFQAASVATLASTEKIGLPMQAGHDHSESSSKHTKLRNSFSLNRSIPTENNDYCKLSSSVGYQEINKERVRPSLRKVENENITAVASAEKVESIDILLNKNKNNTNRNNNSNNYSNNNSIMCKNNNNCKSRPTINCRNSTSNFHSLASFSVTHIKSKTLPAISQNSEYGITTMPFQTLFGDEQFDSAKFTRSFSCHSEMQPSHRYDGYTMNVTDSGAVIVSKCKRRKPKVSKAMCRALAKGNNRLQQALADAARLNESAALLGSDVCPGLHDVLMREPLINKKISEERLTSLEFREDCIITASQDGRIYVWARPLGNGVGLGTRNN